MAKRATFAEVCLRPVQCFILLRQSCVFKFVCARKTPAQHRPMQSCAWNRVFHHSRPHNSRIGSEWKTAFISPMLIDTLVPGPVFVRDRTKAPANALAVKRARATGGYVKR